MNGSWDPRPHVQAGDNASSRKSATTSLTPVAALSFRPTASTPERQLAPHTTASFANSRQWCHLYLTHRSPPKTSLLRPFSAMYLRAAAPRGELLTAVIFSTNFYSETTACELFFFRIAPIVCLWQSFALFPLLFSTQPNKPNSSQCHFRCIFPPARIFPILLW